ncbi:MFS transporter [Mariniphaga sediminis]|jgi:MFS family permease|uniref:Lysosomal dipeptide transporter MFSD1 n=1 Tax=Mariniphaga sediminis TaxID=1628158 RepID=A0A399D092_9BACT|nr:MFS transporter [Mariniphaga sediminis]RIH63770.1 MFS transporter [Mariniphaga sediminis]
MKKDTSGKTWKDSVALRWVVLILVSGLMFSTYWFQDFFSGLKGLMESELGFTSEEFGRLIGFTTIANMFGMIIVGGIILDKWGLRLAGLLFGGLAAVGAVIVALGSAGFFGEDKSVMLNTMILGRIMFGSGLEVVCVVCTRAVVKWFKGYELALAMAINVGFGRLGTALGMALSVDIGKGFVTPAISFAATLIGLTLIMFLIYIVFDIKLDRQVKGQNAGNNLEEEEEEDFRFSDLIKLITNSSFLYIALLCVTFYAGVFPFIQYAPDLLVNKFGFSYNLPEGQGNFILFGSTNFGNTMVYVGLFIFGLAFSMIPSKRKTAAGKMLAYLVIFAVFYAAIYSMRDTLSLWLQNGPKTASLIPLGTILFTPIFGNYVDKKGKAASLMILGSFLLIFAHISLSVFNNVILGYLGLVSLGVAFSLVPAAMWPSVAKIVAEKRLGTAYATMFTLQNWGLGLFFWGIGAVLDLANKQNLEAIRAGEMMYDYTIPVLMLVVCGVVSIFLSFLLKKADRRQKYGLELPSGQKPE